MSGTCSASFSDRRRARAPARTRARRAVEELAAPVARGLGDGAVGEAARVQLHLGARRRERRAQRVVVGRRVGRGVDDVDAHGSGDNTARRWPSDGSVELTYCVVNTSQRELLLRGLDAIARERAQRAVRDRGAGARQRLARRLGAGGARAPDGRRDDRAGRAPGQGGQRHRAAAPRARALRAAAERGLRAAAGGDARAVAGARGSTRARPAPGPSCCARTGTRSRRRGASPAR